MSIKSQFMPRKVIALAVALPGRIASKLQSVRALKLCVWERQVIELCGWIMSGRATSVSYGRLRSGQEMLL